VETSSITSDVDGVEKEPAKSLELLECEERKENKKPITAIPKPSATKSAYMISDQNG